ncbi:MAG: helix-turn-helix transcriptional regulator [Deltaproteobacteria bacterium]|nr:helix-turn-helix transcriptional regulator [Deltaproteobacteria bacterium]
MKRARTRKTKNDLRKGFVKRLRIVRGNRSQAQFARDLDVFQQNINRYEHGTLPHVDFLIALARAENVSVDWLLMGRGSRSGR